MKKIIGFIIVVLILLIFTIYVNIKEPDNLGVKNSELKELSSKPNGVSTQTKYEDKKVTPLKFDKSTEEFQENIVNILNEFKNIKIITKEDNYIHAVASSSFFRFKDDIEFFLDEKNNVIHYRSEARVGHYDFEVNLKRYKKIRNYLKLKR